MITSYFFNSFANPFTKVENKLIYHLAWLQFLEHFFSFQCLKYFPRLYCLYVEVVKGSGQ